MGDADWYASLVGPGTAAGWNGLKKLSIVLPSSEVSTISGTNFFVPTFDNLIYDLNLPTAATVAATSTTATGTTLNGTVNANGSSTAVTFEYGTTTSYGSTVTASQSPVTGSNSTNVSAAVTGLSCGTTYYYRVKAVNTSGTTYSSGTSVTTSACNTAPSFVGSTTSFSAKSATATDISGLLHISDTDSSQTLTWSSYTAPSHGTLTISSATATSGSSNVTPGGTITYTSTSGYTGSDSFAVQVSDGTATATRTLTATVYTVPDVPTGVSATAGDAQASVTFTAPSSNGGATIDSYLVTSSGGQTATGAVSPITVNGLTNGTAYTFMVQAHNTAGYSMASAASSAVTPRSSQSITFANPGTQYYGTTLTLTLNSSAGLAITYTTDTSTVCTVSGNVVSLVGVGTCTLRANQSGNTTWAAATEVGQTFTVSAVAPGVPTIGTATAGNTQATVTFTAPASNGGSAITSYTVTSSPGNIAATGTASPIVVGGLTNGTSYTFTVMATNSTGNSLISVASNAVTPKNTQTIRGLAFLPATLAVGGTTTASATVDSGLSLTFSSLTTSVCTVRGATVTGVAAGPCTIAANQAGNTAISAASQVTVDIAVSKGSQTISAITFTPTALAIGQTATVATTATSGLNVTFSSTTTSICTVSGSTVTAVANGTCTIQADQAGSSNYNAATSVTQNLTVADPPKLTLSELSDGSTTAVTVQNISGTTTDAMGVSSLTINGTTVTVNNDGTFSYPVELQTGANTVTVISTNTVGVTTTAKHTITLDTTVPLLAVTSTPDNAITSQSSVTIVGTISSVSELGSSPAISYSVNGGTTQTATLSGNTFLFNADLAASMNTIRVFTSTAGGQTIETKRTINYATGFSLGLIGAAEDSETALGNYTITGLITDNSTSVTVTVSADGQTYSPTVANGVFQQKLPFAENKVYTIGVTAIDGSGNSRTIYHNFIHVSTVATTIPIYSVGDTMLTLRMKLGTVTPTSDQIQEFDAAPLSNGTTNSDGSIDIDDALIMLRTAVGAQQ